MEAGPVPWRYARAQLPVLGSFVRLVASGWRRPGLRPEIPGRPLSRVVSPRASEHLRAYCEHVGAEHQEGEVPPHLFPHWCFPLTGRLVSDLPYRMLSAVNAGCDVRVRRPIPAGERLEVEGWLVSVDEGERRILVKQRFLTSTSSAPGALEADVTLLVPRRGPKGEGRPKAPERVPDLATVVGYIEANARAGLDFAKLTGDFNPLHWSPRYARAFGFPNTILHGFSTAARAWAALEARSGRPLERFTCRFPRPVVLPASLGVFARGREVWVGEAPGDEARLVGSFA
jgi:acyl dehydratase